MIDKTLYLDLSDELLHCALIQSVSINRLDGVDDPVSMAPTITIKILSEVNFAKFALIYEFQYFELSCFPLA